MLFHSPLFLIFFILVFILHWGFKSNEWRKGLLLVASYLFYGCWDWRFTFLLFFATALAYLIAYLMEETESIKKRRVLLTLAVAGNLVVLGFFKYFNFFTQSFVALANQLGVSVGYDVIAIILPVGISFYTFQALSYTIDVYRKKLPAEKSFLNVALFVAFFPQLVAGPIVHAKDFLPYINLPKFLKDIPWKACILLFLFGLVKKVVVADNLGGTVDQIFSHPKQFDNITVSLGVVLFAIQIYCDFSGYSDMAIALSRVFGFNLPLNFAWPYFAANISEFWHRWHISLSTWWRDYFYIPLGGNRHGKLKQDRNLLTTMSVAGLWHGAAWTFVIWGAVHGLLLIIYHHVNRAMSALNINHHFDFLREKCRIITTSYLGKKLLHILSIALTFWLVCLCWIYFRADSLPSANIIVKKYLFLTTGGRHLLGFETVLAILVLLICHYLTYILQPVQNAEKYKIFPFGIATGGTLFVVLVGQAIESLPFIYFQF